MPDDHLHPADDARLAVGSGPVTRRRPRRLDDLARPPEPAALAPEAERRRQRLAHRHLLGRSDALVEPQAAPRRVPKLALAAGFVSIATFSGAVLAAHGGAQILLASAGLVALSVAAYALRPVGTKTSSSAVLDPA